MTETEGLWEDVGYYQLISQMQLYFGVCEKCSIAGVRSASIKPNGGAGNRPENRRWEKTNTTTVPADDLCEAASTTLWLWYM